MATAASRPYGHAYGHTDSNAAPDPPIRCRCPLSSSRSADDAAAAPVGSAAGGLHRTRKQGRIASALPVGLMDPLLYPGFNAVVQLLFAETTLRNSLLRLSTDDEVHAPPHTLDEARKLCTLLVCCLLLLSLFCVLVLF